MYKHYETSADVFVDREEHIEWMNNALERCKKKSVVLHLKGIGGIGKSSLLTHWVNTHEKTIRLDCEQYSEFYQRLNMLAKGAVLKGVKLQRFDILWQIRQRFVEGVEPVREEGREWAKEVIMAIPFIGSLASIGSAINAVSAKVTPKLKGKYGTIGKWLQENLGNDYIEQLLEILWKDPRRAEFLYLSAFLEDVNNRDNSGIPLLFLLDHFEYVDDEKTQWRFQGKKITETELWTTFLSNLANCVGVIASRRSAAEGITFEIEETELTELDRDSCFEMLELEGVVNRELEERIVSVSGGNPFVIDVICDMIRTTKVSVSDIESLRADSLSEVRLKVWRRLFREAEGLHNLINRAGLVPYFDERIMRIIAPEMTPDSWDRLRRLSFVVMRSDGSFVLHDLAEEMVRTELGKQLTFLGEEVSSLLTRESEEESDPSLLGMALSVEALLSEEEAILKAKNIIFRLLRRESCKDALGILKNLSFRTVRGRAEQKGMLGWALLLEASYAEAEAAVRDATSVFEELAEKDFTNSGASLGFCLSILGEILFRTSRSHEGEECFIRAIEIQRRLGSTGIEENLENLAETLANSGMYLANYLDRTDEGLPLAQEAVEIYRQIKNQKQLPWALETLAMVQQDFEQKVKSFQEALDLQRELCIQEPDNTRFKAVLAAICSNFCWSLVHLDRVKEAEDLINEATRVRRELCEIDPDVYGSRLSLTLFSYGSFLWWSGQISKFEQVLNESLPMFEKLAEKEPGSYDLSLCDQLFDKARLLIIHGRISEVCSVINRAECLLRERSEQEGEPYLAKTDLALDVGAVSLALYKKTLNMADAEKSLNEAIQILSGLRNRSSLNESHFGAILNNGGAYYLSVDKVSKAKNLLEDAASILKTDRVLFSRHNYPVSLGNFAIACRRMGQLREAKRFYQESLEIFGEITNIIPNRSQYNATLTLNNYSLLLKELDRLEEAESRLSEAIEIQKHFTEIEPQYFEPILAISLNNQGILLADMNRFSDAEESLKESTGIRRRLVDQSPEMYQLGLASSLHNLGVLLYNIKKLPEAEQALNEARSIWGKLLHKAPELLNPKLGKTLHYLRLVLLDDQSREAEVKDIKKLLSRMKFDFPDAGDLWIEEEEPLHIW